MEILDFLRLYWSVILFIGTVIISWTRYEAKNAGQDKRLDDLEKRLAYTESKLEAHVKNTDLFREEIKADIREIKTTLEFIGEAIKELKEQRKRK